MFPAFRNPFLVEQVDMFGRPTLIPISLVRKGKAFYVTLFPALFMTAVCTTYILVAPEGFGLSYVLSCAVGGGVAVLLFGMFMKWYLQFKKTRV